MIEDKVNPYTGEKYSSYSSFLYHCTMSQGLLDMVEKFQELGDTISPDIKTLFVIHDVTGGIKFSISKKVRTYSIPNSVPKGIF